MLVLLGLDEKHLVGPLIDIVNGDFTSDSDRKKSHKGHTQMNTFTRNITSAIAIAAISLGAVSSASAAVFFKYEGIDSESRVQQSQLFLEFEDVRFIEDIDSNDSDASVIGGVFDPHYRKTDGSTSAEESREEIKFPYEKIKPTY